ncbi:MAG: hypothetical protein KAV87_38985 [Desulfobacteraceae bacterium]|nr:hypothetical protein [Desulfobacteraceae bacterium]
MYYVLFNFTKLPKGSRTKSFETFRSEDDVIEYLHENYRYIDVYRIIETARSYRLSLVVTEELVKSVLEPQEETESLVPINKEKEVAPIAAAIIQGKNPKEILRQNKKTLEELEAGEPSAMSKIGEDIESEMKEGELTDDEKVEASIDEADQIIEREKQRQEQKKKGWKLCSECNSNRVAPWNKKQICSVCQNKKKTDRPYSRSKEFAGL